MDLLGLLILLGAGLVCFVLSLVAYTTWLLTHPPRRGYAYALSRGVPGDPAEVAVLDPATGNPVRVEYSSWALESRGRSLPVWDIRGLEPTGPTMIVTHGWGDSRVILLARLPALIRLAHRVVLWDLPGHGEASGTCALGTREEADLRALIQRLRIDDDSPMVLYGFSLGAGLSIAAAGDQRISAIIAEAPYRLPWVPAQSVLRLRGLPWRINLSGAMLILGVRWGYGLHWFRRTPDGGGFDRAAAASRLACPLLVLHGDADPVSPPQDGRDIAGAVPNGQGRFGLIPGGGHNDLWIRPEFAQVAERAVAEFLASRP